MAQYGRLRIVVQDSSGNAVSGASVEVRRQGASVNGNHAGTNTSFTVNDPGAIVAGDSIRVNTLDSPTRSCSSVTATNVTVGGAGFLSLDDDDRLTIASSLPTIYNDAQGAETKSNPMTTGADGVATCWAEVRPYDILVSGTGITAYLEQDRIPMGHERVTSNAFGGAGPAFILDTSRALSTDDKILSIREATVEKFSVDDDGDVVGAKGTFSGAVSGTTATFTSTGSFTGTLTAVNELQFERPRANQGTAHVAGDWSASAGWGDTPTASITTVGGYDAAGIVGVTSGTANITANPTLTLTYKDGTWGSGAPRPVVSRADNNAPLEAPWVVTASSSTTFTLKFVGTPVASTEYRAIFHAIGIG